MILIVSVPNYHLWCSGIFNNDYSSSQSTFPWRWNFIRWRTRDRGASQFYNHHWKQSNLFHRRDRYFNFPIAFPTPSNLAVIFFIFILFLGTSTSPAVTAGVAAVRSRRGRDLLDFVKEVAHSNLHPHIITWSHGENCLIIHDKTKFEEQLLGEFHGVTSLSGSQLRNSLRCLYRRGWRKIRLSPSSYKLTNRQYEQSVAFFTSKISEFRTRIFELRSRNDRNHYDTLTNDLFQAVDTFLINNM